MFPPYEEQTMKMVIDFKGINFENSIFGTFGYM